ncbi:bifunctional riboflavin kinase/FAD synthetase [Gymnodinialimonas ceratoperidinii]|uniref:Riboflavin biosynthesis protein n=1 Tax=Gymnodinialimonas ceratoperidinii TaxID=2856823 RepID=A0A8F6TYZ8_9RHOB|nr:bifunctional riboflavin kinase/FAD synthetase [Gymnodinialimonas ceratoperidinii]QXT40759.1 bifunctional riboflavin kinase/FAD synthetase [Gymnodinialimonas ceratoperidinii]
MKILRDHQYAAPADKGASVAIGNFDGVHRGHQHVLNLAKRLDAPLGVVTFEPHPRQVFAPDAPPFRLMNAEARANRLRKLGVNLLAELPFDTRLKSLSDVEFVRDVLVASLGISHAVVGADFRFGKDRTGSADTLKQMGAEYGFDVTIADLLEGETGAVSSTAIRTALTEGRPADAAAMLGHWHRIEGPVLHGEKRGRELGYPTANMGLDGLHVPKPGVYAVTVDVRDGPHAGSYGAVANLGFRPMFELEQPNLETYLFDFAGDLYGAHLSVGLVAYLRGEMKFDSLQDLIAQMDMDSLAARAALRG